jgi:hypothetical protein
MRTAPAALWVCLLVLTAAGLVAVPAVAGPPTLEWLFPPGARRGTTATVTASGSFSHWPPRVWTEDDDVTIAALPEKGKLTVTVAPGARVGVHWLRLFDEEGATTVRPLLVGTLPEVVEVEPNDDPIQPQKLEALAPGVTVNGKLGRTGDVDGFAVPLRKGQTLVAALEANRRLGAPLDGLLQIVSPRGFVLAENDDAPDRDPLIAFEAPADGTYLVRAFAFPAEPDSRIGFAGGDAFLYRLTLTTGGFLDHFYPLAAARAAPGRVEAIGWNIDAAARWLEVVPLAEDADRVDLDHPLLANAGSVRLEAHPAVTEVEPNGPDAPQDVTLPITISGQIDPTRDQDAYRFHAHKGEKWLIRVESRSLGHPLDAVVRVLDASGKIVSEMDDPGSRRRSATRDPELTFTPANDEAYRIVVRDLNGQGSFRHAYRLTMAAPELGFTLTVAGDRFTLTPEKPLKIPVTVARDDGLSAPIDVEALGLPEEVIATQVTSKPAGPSAKTVTLELCTHQGPWSGPFRIIGRLPDGPPTPATVSPPRPATGTTPPAGLAVPGDRLWLTVAPKK